jgi:hypothetical protein
MITAGLEVEKRLLAEERRLFELEKRAVATERGMLDHGMERYRVGRGADFERDARLTEQQMMSSGYSG